MTPLPSGLADPLHLAFPVHWKWLAVAAALFLATVILLLLRVWLRRRRRRVRARPEPAPRQLPPAGILDEIEALRGRYRTGSGLRRACHELSALLRGYFGRSSPRFSTLTAGEIRRHLGDGRTASFFGSLARVQFGRSRPTRKDFDGVCDLAIEAVREGTP